MIAARHDGPHYRVEAADPAAHLFHVTLTVAQPQAGQRVSLPAWIPGSYLIREFARQFVDVRAESAGAPLPIVKIAKDVWHAAPAQAAITVVAQVYAYDLSVRTAYVVVSNSSGCPSIWP